MIAALVAPATASAFHLPEWEGGESSRSLRSASGATNGRITYARGSANREIYTMRADGGDRVKLTTANTTQATPRWSPDGTKIAFSTARDGNSEIYVMNADGSSPANISNFPSNAEFSPSWSPDGALLAFYSNRTGSTDIFRMDATTGAGQTQLGGSPSADEGPVWSPDGTRIAFISARDDDHDFEIFTMNADGTNPVQLTFNAADEFHPTWSPDGTKIAFTSARDGLSNYEIYTMNADGSDQVNISKSPNIDWEPDWSPDGTLIAFSSNRTGDYEIWSMAPDGANPVNLTNVPGGDYQPDWQQIGGTTPSVPAPTPATTTPPATTPADPAPTPPPACASKVSSWVPTGYRSDFAATDKELEIDLDAAAAGWQVSGEVRTKLFGTVASGSVISKGTGEERLVLPVKASARAKLRNPKDSVDATLTLSVSKAGCAKVTSKPVAFTFVDPDDLRARSTSTSIRARAAQKPSTTIYGDERDYSPNGYCRNYVNSYANPEVFAGYCTNSSSPGKKKTCAEWKPSEAVQLGPIEAFSDCFIFDPETGSYDSSRLVRLNGLELVPQSGEISINRQTNTLSSSGPVRIYLRGITGGYAKNTYGQFAKIDTDEGLRVELPFNRRIPTTSFTRDKVLALPMPPIGATLPLFFKGLKLEAVKGAFEFSHDGGYGTGKVSVTLAVAPPLPDAIFGAKVPNKLGLSVETTVTATNSAATNLSVKTGFSGPALRFRALRLAALELRDLSMVASTDRTAVFRGEVALLAPSRNAAYDKAPTVAVTMSISGEGITGVGFSLDGLNRPIAPAPPLGLFLQRLGLSVAPGDPFSLTGNAGVTLGPSLFFKEIGFRAELASLDGAITAAYRKGDNPIVPSELTFGPAVLKVASLFQLGQAQLKMTPEGTTFFGTVGLPPQILRLFGFVPSFDAAVYGSLKGRDFAAAGSYKFSYLGASFSTTLQVNNKALVFCTGPSLAQAGAAYLWETREIRAMTGACGMRPGKPAKPRAAKRQEGGETTYTVASGLTAKTFAFTGTSAPPRVALVGPDGTRVETPAEPTGGVLTLKAMLIQDPATRRTTITLFSPKAGAWRVSLLPNSSPLAATDESDPQPAPDVEGRVTLRRATDDATLAFDAEGLDGRRMRLVERVGTEEQEIGSTRSSSSLRTFTPLPQTGLHRIVAVVEDSDGVPQAEVPVTRFRVARVDEADPMETCRVRRTGSRIRLVWGREDDDLKQVVAYLKLKDGRVTSRTVSIDSRSFLFTGVPTDQNAAVGCTGVDDRGKFSKPVYIQTKGKPLPRDPVPVNDPSAELGFALVE